MSIERPGHVSGGISRHFGTEPLTSLPSTLPTGITPSYQKQKEALTASVKALKALQMEQIVPENLLPVAHAILAFPDSNKHTRRAMKAMENAVDRLALSIHEDSEKDTPNLQKARKILSLTKIAMVKRVHCLDLIDDVDSAMAALREQMDGMEVGTHGLDLSNCQEVFVKMGELLSFYKDTNSDATPFANPDKVHGYIALEMQVLNETLDEFVQLYRRLADAGIPENDPQRLLQDIEGMVNQASSLKIRDLTNHSQWQSVYRVLDIPQASETSIRLAELRTQRDALKKSLGSLSAELSKARPTVPESKIHNLQRWQERNQDWQDAANEENPERTRYLSIFFGALLLGQEAQQWYSIPARARAFKEEKRIFGEILHASQDPTLAKRVNTEKALIGTALSDFWERCDDRSYLTKITKGNEPLQQAILAVKAQHPHQPPSNEEIYAAQAAWEAASLVPTMGEIPEQYLDWANARPHLFAELPDSFDGFWELFTTNTDPLAISSGVEEPDPWIRMHEEYLSHDIREFDPETYPPVPVSAATRTTGVVQQTLAAGWSLISGFAGDQSWESTVAAGEAQKKLAGMQLLVTETGTGTRRKLFDARLKTLVRQREELSVSEWTQEVRMLERDLIGQVKTRRQEKEPPIAEIGEVLSKTERSFNAACVLVDELLDSASTLHHAYYQEPEFLGTVRELYEMRGKLNALLLLKPPYREGVLTVGKWKQRVDAVQRRMLRLNRLVEGYQSQCKGSCLEEGAFSTDNPLLLAAAIPVDDQLLLHIHGESFGRGTELEQAPVQSTTDYLATFLKAQQEVGGNTELYADELRGLQLAAEMEQEIYGPARSVPPNQWEGAAPSLVKKLADRMRSLAPEDRLQLPVATTNFTVFIEITVDEDECYKVRLVNSAGIHTRHQTRIDGLQTLLNPFLESKNVSVESLTEPSLLRHLLEMQTRSVDARGAPIDWEDKDLYEAWFDLLDGDSYIPELDHDRWIPEERSNVGPWKGLMQMQSANMSPAQFKRLEFNIRLKSLYDYHQKQQADLHTRPKSTALLKKTLEQLSRDILGLYKDKFINDSELSLGKLLIDEVSKSNSLAELRTLDLKLGRNTIVTLPNEGAVGDLGTITVVPPEEITPIAPKGAYQALDTRSWTPNAGTLLEDLSSWNARINEMQESHHYEVASTAIEEIVSRIPLPTSNEAGKALWEGLDSGLAEEVLVQLGHFQRVLFLNEARGSRAGLGYSYSHTILASMKCFALSSACLRRLPDDSHLPYKMPLGINEMLQLRKRVDGDLPNYYYRNHYSEPGSFNLPETTANFETFTPQEDAQWQEFYDYFKQSEYFARHPQNPDYNFFTNTCNHRDYSPSDDHFRKSQEYAFAKDLMENHPEFLQRIPEGHPLAKIKYESEYGHGQENKHAMYALGDPEQKILPQWFYLFKEQYWLCHKLCVTSPQGPIGDTTQAITSDTSFKDDQSEFVLLITGLGDLYDPRQSVGPATPNQEAGIQASLKSAGHTAEDESFRLESLAGLTSGRWGGTGQSALNTAQRKVMITTPPEGMSLQTHRQISSLRGGGEGQQLIRVLSYYLEENPALLRKPEHQAFISRFGAFEGSHTSDELKDNPDLSHTAARMLKKSYDRSKGMGDLQAATFLLRLNRRLQAFAAFAESGKELSSRYLDTAAEVESLLKEQHPSAREAGLLRAEQAASFLHVNQINGEEEALTLIESALYGVSSYKGPQVDDPQIQEEIRRALLLHRVALQKAVQSPAGQERLSALLKDFEGVSQSWDLSTFPILSTTDGRYKLDVLSAKIGLTETGNQLALEPGEFAWLKKALDLPPAELLTVELGTENEMYARSPRGRRMRFVGNKEDGVVYAQMQDGGWAREVPPLSEGDFRQRPDSIPSKILTDASRYRHWVSHKPSARLYVMDKETHGVAAICELEEIPEVIEQPSFWSSVVSLVYTPESNTEKKTTDFIIKEVRRPNEDESPSELSLMQTWPEYGWIRRLDDIYNVHVWMDRDTKEPKHIELPRIKYQGAVLEFDVVAGEQAKVAKSRNFPGFHISAHQRVKGLGDLDTYLVLEDDSGERKVIIPASSPHCRPGAALSTVSSMPLAVTSEVLAYKVSELDEMPQSDSPAGNFRLAQIYLLQHRYKEAHQILSLYENNLQAFNSSDQAQLEAFAGMLDQAADGDPRANSLWLHAQAVGWMNGKEGGGQGSIEQGRYLSYLSQLKDQTILALPQYIEEQIIEMIPSAPYTNPIIANRLSQFKSEIARHLMEGVKLESSRAQEVDLHRIEEVLRNGICAFGESVKPEKVDDHSETAILSRLGSASTLYSWTNQQLAKIAAMSSQGKDLSGLAREMRLKRLHAFPKLDREVSPSDSLLIGTLTALEVIAANHELCDFEKITVSNEDRWGETTSYEDWNYSELAQKAASLLEAEQVFAGGARPLAVKVTPAEALVESMEIEDQSALHLSALPSPQPLISNFNHYFEEIPLDEEALSLRREQGQILRELFDSPKADRVTARKFLRVQEDIDVELQRTPDSDYKPLDQQRFIDLHAQWSQELPLDGQRLRLRERELLAFANELPRVELEAVQRELGIAGQDIRKLTVDDLYLFVLRRNRGEMQRANPVLQGQKAQHLVDLVAQHLVDVTQVEHKQRIMNNLERYIANPGNVSLAKKIANAMRQERCYNPAEHPEYLVFEHYGDILIYPAQVEKLSELFTDLSAVNKKGTVIELIMGAGKTYVILPLVGLVEANGDTLSTIMMPDSLLVRVAKEMRDRQAAVGQMMHVVRFSRHSDYSEGYLIYRKQELERSIKEGRILMMSGSSLQSLFLKYIEMRMDGGADEKVLLLMEEILHLFATKGSLKMDEIDLQVYPRRELRYTRSEPSHLPDAQVNVEMALMDTLLMDEELLSEVAIDFLGNKAPKALTPEVYEEVVKPRIAERYIDGIINAQVGTGSVEAKAFFSSLSSMQRSLVTSYLVNASASNEAFALVDSLKSEELQDMLALSRQLLQHVFANTLTKLYNEHYGLSKDDPWGVKVSIPYQSKDTPNEALRWGFPYQGHMLTTQCYLREGIPWQLVREEVEELASVVIKETQRGVPLEEIHAYQRIKELAGGQSVNLLKISDEQMREIAQQLNQQRSLQLDFIKRRILPSFEVHTKNLVATPQIFSALFAKMGGFTGTLGWIEETLPASLEVKPTKGTDGMTLLTLWQKSKGKVFSVPAGDGRQIIESIFSNPDRVDNAQSLIDGGGVLKGISDIEVVRLLLERPELSAVNGVIFFSGEETLILERGKDNPVPVSEAVVPADQRFSYYAQRYTTGTNYKHRDDAKAICTIGQATRLRDFLQYVWRMRGLMAGQQFDFIVPGDVAQIIRENLSLNGDTEIDIGHVFQFVTNNEAREMGSNNFLSMQQRAEMRVQMAIIGVLIDPKFSAEEKSELFEEAMPLFETNATFSPYQLFGRAEETLTAEQACDRIFHQTLSHSVRALFQNNALLKSEKPIAELEKEVRSELKPELLSETLTLSPVTQDTEISLLQQMLLQKENEQMLEEEPALELVGLSKKPFTDWNWKATLEELFCKSTWSPRHVEEVRNVQNWGVGTPPVFSMDACLDPEFQGIFDPELLTTINFEMIAPQNRDQKPTEAFDLTQQPVNEFILVEDPSTGKLSLVLIGQLEDVELATALRLDRCCDANGVNREVRLAKGERNSGLSHFGADRIDTDHLAQNPKYLRLHTQMRFLNGDVDYTAEELNVLREWFKEKGVARMHKLFSHKILQFKDRSTHLFKVSRLRDLFEEMLAETPEDTKAWGSWWW